MASIFRKQLVLILPPKIGSQHRDLLSFFENPDWETSLAIGPADLLHRVHREHIDMIMIDATTEEADIEKLLKNIRSRLLPSQLLPIIMILPENADESIAAPLYRVGVADVVRRPLIRSIAQARVGAWLRIRRMHEQLAETRANVDLMNNELEVAMREMLPREIPHRGGWRIDVHYEPAEPMAGDSYNIFELSRGRIAILLGDALGRGIRSITRMAVVNGLVRARLEQEESPAALLAEINRTLVALFGDDSMMSLYLAIVDFESNCVVQTAAGYPGPLMLARESKSVDWREIASGPPLGVDANARYSSMEFAIRKGEGMLMTTNGAWQRRDPEGRELGIEEFCNYIRSGLAEQEPLLASIAGRMKEFSNGAPARDDVAMILLERKTT